MAESRALENQRTPRGKNLTRLDDLYEMKRKLKCCYIPNVSRQFGQIFLYPTADEQKAKMPPPPPNASQTVTMSHDDAIAAAAAVVVDAAVTYQGNSNVGTSVSQMRLDTTSGGLVTDPISYNIDEEDNGMIESI